MSQLGKILIIAGVLALIANSTCFAGSVDVSTKLKGGLVNLFTGWTEVPRQASQVYKDTNNISEALTMGILKGVILGIGRTVAGAIDTVFFFMPPYDKPMMEPLYQI